MTVRPSALYDSVVTAPLLSVTLPSRAGLAGVVTSNWVAVPRPSPTVNTCPPGAKAMDVIHSDAVTVPRCFGRAGSVMSQRTADVVAADETARRGAVGLYAITCSSLSSVI